MYIYKIIQCSNGFGQYYAYYAKLTTGLIQKPNVPKQALITLTN